MAAKEERLVPDEAVSVAGRALPPVPREICPDTVTQILFYQYKEPVWTKKQLLATLHEIERLAAAHEVTGRGRIALEGLNCTLTAPAYGARRFCYGLRKWNPEVFDATDFKLTDGVPKGKKFKALTIKRTNELVAYGLDGDKAPLLHHNAAKHLDALEYHEMLKRPNTVVIDVRNGYETAIGRMQPPEGGAELLDPLMRNSHEFPKWLSKPETQQKLQGKEVMMYCTGGIRCERASALLDQMTKASDKLEVGGISMVRGGLDRYLKTFPDGGFWKGRNYLFDLREEQAAEGRSAEQLTAEVDSKCCICAKPWAVYEGKFTCSEKQCKVPVIVCRTCCGGGAQRKVRLLCPQCKSGYSLRDEPMPDLVAMKRKIATRGCKRRQLPNAEPSQRLFVGKLPIGVSLSQVRVAVAQPVNAVVWLLDRKTSLFYGSAFLQMASLSAAQAVFQDAAAGRLVMGNRRLLVNYAPVASAWPPAGHKQLEYPPVPVEPWPANETKKRKKAQD